MQIFGKEIAKVYEKTLISQYKIHALNISQCFQKPLWQTMLSGKSKIVTQGNKHLKCLFILINNYLSWTTPASSLCLSESSSKYYLSPILDNVTCSVHPPAFCPIINKFQIITLLTIILRVANLPTSHLTPLGFVLQTAPRSV